MKHFWTIKHQESPLKTAAILGMRTSYQQGNTDETWGQL